MWRLRLSRQGVAVHRGIIQEISHASGSPTLVSDMENGIPPGAVLAIVPQRVCVSPTTFRSFCGASYSPASFYNKSYAYQNDKVSLELAPETVATTLYTGLILNSPSHPLYDYIHSIVIGREDTTSLQKKMGPELFAKLKELQRANQEALLKVWEEGENTSFRIPFETLQQAHAICESRCVDVPGGEQTFGGPILAPFVDLINHSFAPPNIAVFLETQARAKRLALRWSSSITTEFFEEFDSSSQYFVVVRAATTIKQGEELHYPYMTKDDNLAQDMLLWALRFHFIPSEITHSSIPQKTTQFQ